MASSQAEARMTSPASLTPEARDRLKGMILGMFLADAHAMPTHWYYDVEMLKQDYGFVTDFLAPKDEHPQSMVSGQTGYYDGKIDILHDKKKHYVQEKPEEGGYGTADQRFGKTKPHYHLGMRPGENTCNLHVALMLMRVVNDKKKYTQELYLDAFYKFFTTPGHHPDTYLDIYIRKFFENTEKGWPLTRCARDQREQWSIGSMGGLIASLPLVILYVLEPTPEACARVIEHHSLTHRSLNVTALALILVPLLRNLVWQQGDALENVREALGQVRGPRFSGRELMETYVKANSPYNLDEDLTWYLHTQKAREPFSAQVDAALGKDFLETEAKTGEASEMEKRVQEDRKVCGDAGLVSSACYTEHGTPAALYLACRYRNDFRASVIANTNLGGDNCTRGALLGAIVGAACGYKGLPADWLDKLVLRAELEKQVDQLLDLASTGENF